MEATQEDSVIQLCEEIVKKTQTAFQATQEDSVIQLCEEIVKKTQTVYNLLISVSSFNFIKWVKIINRTIRMINHLISKRNKLCLGSHNKLAFNLALIKSIKIKLMQHQEKHNREKKTKNLVIESSGSITNLAHKDILLSLIHI